MAKTVKKPVKTAKKPALPATIQWLEQRIALSKLRPYDRNPRRISKEAFDLLKANIEKNGYHQRILCTIDLRVIGGHQRIKALKDLGYKEVNILTPDREITLGQFKEILIKDNLPFGEFDFDMLSADFEVDELLAFGMPKDWLPVFDPADMEGEPAEPTEKEEIEPQLVHCPKCKHEFSILTKADN